MNKNDAQIICDLLETGDNRCMAVDGPVCQDTLSMLDRKELRTLYLAASRIAKQEKPKDIEGLSCLLTVEEDNEAFGCSVLWYEFEKDKQTLVFGHADPRTLHKARAMIFEIMNQAYTAGVAKGCANALSQSRKKPNAVRDAMIWFANELHKLARHTDNTMHWRVDHLRTFKEHGGRLDETA